MIYIQYLGPEKPIKLFKVKVSRNFPLHFFYILLMVSLLGCLVKLSLYSICRIDLHLKQLNREK